jgi:two-component system, LytTR family, sensor kinase
MFSQNLKNSLLTLALLLMVWAPVEAFLLNQAYGLEWRTALLDSAMTSLFIAAAGFVIINTLNFYHPEKKRIPYLLLGVLLFAYVAGIGAEFTIQSLTEGPVLYIRDFHWQREIFVALITVLIFTITWFQTSKRSTTEDDQRRAATEKIAREAELASLRQQLQPHFLFNSLNSINALIGTQPEKARKMVQQLSDFLRGTIKKDDNQLVPLFEEIQQLRLYLDIEKVRFGHRLSAHIDSDNASLSCKLPPLLMQPVVENAIKFGLYDTVGETVIHIKTKMESNQLVIDVDNPFDSSTATPRQGTGFGLSSLQRRLYLLYGRNDLLSTLKNEDTFTTQIRIPQQA